LIFQAAPLSERCRAAGFQALYAIALLVGCVSVIRLVMLVLGRTPGGISWPIFALFFGIIVITGFLRPDSSLQTRALFERLRSNWK